MKRSVMIHHSAGPDGAALDYVGIRRYHTLTLGWRDIGYHLVVEMTGEEPVALLGRPLSWAGAHAGVGMYNRFSIGVCFVGNYDKVRPAERLLAEGARQIAGLCRELQLDPVESDVILAHRDVRDTACPGREFPMTHLRDLIVDAM